MLRVQFFANQFGMKFKGIAKSNMEQKARAILAREGYAAMEEELQKHGSSRSQVEMVVSSAVRRLPGCTTPSTVETLPVGANRSALGRVRRLMYLAARATFLRTTWN